MASFLEGTDMETNYDIIEFFSGTARVSRLAKKLGHNPAALDIGYDCTAPPPKAKKKERCLYPNARSAMDINTSAGFLPLSCYS